MPKELANTLKYGSLPLSFAASEAETVSATLGLASLQAALIAGAVGLVLVLLYCLVYYRMLGVLTALSLILSGVMVYAIMVLLGRYIGFTLDLAGMAGLIIGIGMTADSFVVFFERIKDEMREGRSFRFGGATRLGKSTPNNSFRQRGELHRRRSSVRACGRTGARLRLHLGSDDHSRRDCRVPRDVATGQHGVPFGVLVQAQRQRSRRSARGCPRT